MPMRYAPSVSFARTGPMATRLPLRSTTRLNGLPFVARMCAGMSFGVTRTPAMLSTLSPFLTPTAAAGVPGTTLPTIVVLCCVATTKMPVKRTNAKSRFTAGPCRDRGEAAPRRLPPVSVRCERPLGLLEQPRRADLRAQLLERASARRRRPARSQRRAGRAPPANCSRCAGGSVAARSPGDGRFMPGSSRSRRAGSSRSSTPRRRASSSRSPARSRR